MYLFCRFELFVLPESFTVHYPHEPSTIYTVSATKGFQTQVNQFINMITLLLYPKYTEKGFITEKLH